MVMTLASKTTMVQKVNTDIQISPMYARLQEEGREPSFGEFVEAIDFFHSERNNPMHNIDNICNSLEIGCTSCIGRRIRLTSKIVFLSQLFFLKHY